MSAIPYNGPPRFDETRNTSGAHVDPNALANAQKALDRSKDKDWYKWIVARQNGEHLHGTLIEKTGKPACCPVPGCPG